MNEASFDWCNKYGYTLERYTLRSNGQSLSYQNMIASKIVLMDSIGPVTDSLWDLQDTSDLAQIAAGALYGERFNTFDLDTSKLSTRHEAQIKNYRSFHTLQVKLTIFGIDMYTFY